MSIQIANPFQKRNRKFTSQQKLHILKEWEYMFQQQRKKFKTQLLVTESSNRSIIELYEENRRLRQLKSAVFFWMLNIMQENISFSTIKHHLACKLNLKDLKILYVSSFDEPRYVRKKALVIIFHLYGISVPIIAEFLFLTPRTVKRYISRFKKEGVSKLISHQRKGLKKEKDVTYREKILSIIHAPPAEYDINRTTWTIPLIKGVLAEKGYLAGKNTIGKIIKNAGYRSRKARKVLTSNDPKYRQKLQNITSILSSLGSDDRFFSIDEFGPFAVKKRGGRRLVRNNEYPTIPQWQRSKGFLIITAALELSTNQITHFYSKKKDTEEMIKLLEILIESYSGCKTIYLSFDAASWHSSKAFMKRVETVNTYEFRQSHNSPVVKLAPLPARAQFLNVIESIFSGMVGAIIDNSDCQSVDEAKAAIDRYFEERNEYFRKHPKRAGNKIWGDELVPPRFKEGQNCKNLRWR